MQEDSFAADSLNYDYDHLISVLGKCLPASRGIAAKRRNRIFGVRNWIFFYEESIT